MESVDRININSKVLVSAKELRLGNRFSGMSGFSARRSILLQTPFDPELKNGQDWDLYVRLIQRESKFINIRCALFLYRKGTPNGITEEVKKMDLMQIESRLLSARKHRAWLGETAYKRRVAEQILSYLPNKRHKFCWIKKAVELAGCKATIQTLVLKIVHRVSQLSIVNRA